MSRFESKHLLNGQLLIYLAVKLTLAECHMQVKTVTDACVLTTFTVVENIADGSFISCLNVKTQEFLVFNH